MAMLTMEAAVKTGRPALVEGNDTATMMQPVVIPHGSLRSRKMAG